MTSYVRTTHSASETRDLGRRLGESLRGGEVIALVGDLGSGKTTFTRGLVEGVGCPHAQVSSPTYVLEQVYEGPLRVRHYDAYRLAGADELQALGFDEHLGGGDILVMEWAERVVSLLPADHILVRLDFLADPAAGRQITLSGACLDFIDDSGENA